MAAGNSLRNLIPPKIASASAMGAAPTAKRMTTVVDFYSKASTLDFTH